MKKLLLVGIATIAFAHQTSAMMFKKNESNDFVVANQEESDVVAIDVTPLIIVAKDANDKPIMVRAKEYIRTSSTITIPDTQEIRDIVTGKKMVDAGDGKGGFLYMQETALDKKAMKQWCDDFKNNSQKPGLWTKDHKDKKEHIKTYIDVIFNNNLAKKELFKHIINEFNFVDGDIRGTQATYETQLRKKDKNPVTRVTCCDFVMFDKSPYYKRTQKSLEELSLYNAAENHAYHEALESLMATKDNMQQDLKNTSFFQWIWHNKKYKRTQKSLERLNEEIAFFEDQDSVISPEKKVLSNKKQIFSNKRQQYTKPALTRRGVFTRSYMPKAIYEQVKTARE